MRVLALDEEIPFPQDSGKRLRVHGLLTRMARRHDVTLLCYAPVGGGTDAERSLTGAGMRVITLPPVSRKQTGPLFLAKLAANLLSPLPYVAWNYCARRMRSALRRVLTSERFDLIHSEMTLMSPLLRGIGNVPKVAVAHNVEAEIWRRYEETAASPLRRAYIALQRRRVERLESHGLDHLTALCTVSERDAEWYRPRTHVPIHVVPNGVDLEYFRPHPEPEDPQTLVHAGAMDWRPNVDAVMHFLSEIYPLILKERPGTQFLVVGRSPSQALVRLAARYPGVHVTGSVDDVRPFVARATVFVVPLRVGGGSRLKILNALAMGKAVVSTSVGAEGLHVQDGTDLLVADPPDVFARRTLALLMDQTLRRRLGRAGRVLVESRYGWNAIADRLDAAWNDALLAFRFAHEHSPHLAHSSAIQ